MDHMGTIVNNMVYNFKHPLDIIRTKYTVPNTHVNDVK